MAFTVDSSQARITQITIRYDADGTITVTDVVGECPRADGTEGMTALIYANEVIPASAIKTQLQNLAGQILTRLKTIKRWL